MNTAMRIGAFLGAISFFVLWAFMLWALFDRDWDQVTALAALQCALNTFQRAKQ